MLQFNKPSRQCITEPFSAGGRAKPSFTLHLFDIYGRVLDAKMNISPHNRTATVWRPLGQESDNILLRAGEVNSAGVRVGRLRTQYRCVDHRHWESNFNIYVVKTFVLRHSHIQSFIYFGSFVNPFQRIFSTTSMWDKLQRFGRLKNSSHHQVSSPYYFYSRIGQWILFKQFTATHITQKHWNFILNKYRKQYTFSIFLIWVEVMFASLELLFCMVLFSWYKNIYILRLYTVCSVYLGMPF